ncbi:MAG: ATP-binding cassette domain-containing protein [Trebonia sp.]
MKLGAHLNPGWDAELARGRAGRLDMDPRQKAGTLSGGQRAQLALTLATAKRPEPLILDEPVASLDPIRCSITPVWRVPRMRVVCRALGRPRRGRWSGTASRWPALWRPGQTPAARRSR